MQPLTAQSKAALHDLLTSAFANPWSAAQLAVLGSVDGAESVAEAMERVRAANEGRAHGEEEGPGSPTSPGTRALRELYM